MHSHRDMITHGTAFDALIVPIPDQPAVGKRILHPTSILHEGDSFTLTSRKTHMVVSI